MFGDKFRIWQLLMLLIFNLFNSIFLTVLFLNLYNWGRLKKHAIKKIAIRSYLYSKEMTFTKNDAILMKNKSIIFRLFGF